MNTTTLYAGLDIHATNTVIQSIDREGTMISGQELPTRAEALIGWARNYPHHQLQVILEQGTHARWVANALAPWVDRLVICDPATNALIHGVGIKMIALMPMSWPGCFGWGVQAGLVATHGGAACL